MSVAEWVARAKSLLQRLSASRLLRDAARTSAWNFIGKAVGLLIPIVIAALYGMTAGTDAFFFSYGLVTFLCSVFGPVGRSTVVPFIAEMDAESGERAEQFVGRAFLAVTAIVAAVTTAALLLLHPLLPLITDFSSEVGRLAFLLLAETAPLVLLLTWTALLEGVLNAHKRFALPAVSPAFRAVVALAVIFGLRGRLGLHAVPLGYVAGEAVRVLVLAGSLSRLTPLRFRAGDFAPALPPRVRTFLRVAFYQNLALTAAGLNPVVDRTMASWLPTGGVSVLYYADRLYMIPASLVFTGVMTVVLSHWSGDHYREGLGRLRGNVYRAVRWAAPTALVAAGALVLLAGPLARLLLVRGEFSPAMLPRVVTAWRFYLAGLAPQVVVLLYVQAFLSLKDTRTTMLNAFCVNGLNVGLNYALMWRLGIAGIALSTTLTQVFSLGFLAWRFSRKKG